MKNKNKNKNKNVDVKVTEKKVVDAEEVKDEDEETAFIEVYPASVREFWENLSFKKKLGLILGTVGAAAGAAAGGYFVGRAMASKAETAETLELPSDVIENEISNDEVE